MPRLTSLTSQRMLDDTMTVLQTHIPLQAAGYRCQTDDLWRVLVAATARTRSIEAACASLVTAPHPNTIRGYLTRQWTPEALPTLEAQCNAALQASIPSWLKDRPVEIAIDTHDSPFYGRLTGAATSWVCGGQSRAGTNRHYRCAAVAVLARQARVTVAVTFVQPGETMDAIVARLLAHLDRLSLQIGCLYADKGFCSVAIFQRLLAAKIPAIIAVPQRSDGLRALAQGPESHWESSDEPDSRPHDHPTGGGADLRETTDWRLPTSLVPVRLPGHSRQPDWGATPIPKALWNCKPLPPYGTAPTADDCHESGRAFHGAGDCRDPAESVGVVPLDLSPCARVGALWAPRRVDQTSLRLRRLMAMLHHAVVACYGELEAIPLASYRPYQIEPANL